MNLKTAAAKLQRLVSGYQGAAVCLAAVRLGVFDALTERGMSAGVLARRLGADLRATRMLCDALAALRVLEKEGGSYRNGSVAKLLCSATQGSQRALMLHHASLYERWGELAEVVRRGRPQPRAPRTAREERAFAEAMQSSASLAACATADCLKLTRARTLLDLGGGPGTYGLEFARRHPQLQVTILDGRGAIRVAWENIRQSGMQGRVRGRVGDAFSDDLGGPYDVVFISNVIHTYDASQNRRLLRRVATALAPRGRLCIKDFFFEPGKVEPAFTALFAVNMLVNTERGGCYTVDEVQRWAAAVGLRPMRSVRVDGCSLLVTARKD